MAGLESLANIPELQLTNVFFVLMWYLKQEVLVPSVESANLFTLVNCLFYFCTQIAHHEGLYCILLRAVHLDRVGTPNTLHWSPYSLPVVGVVQMKQICQISHTH